MSGDIYRGSYLSPFACSIYKKHLLWQSRISEQKGGYKSRQTLHPGYKDDRDKKTSIKPREKKNLQRKQSVSLYMYAGALVTPLRCRPAIRKSHCTSLALLECSATFCTTLLSTEKDRLHDISQGLGNVRVYTHPLNVR